MERIWVGFPLNLHRRCEDPMFRVVNEIAYHGQMINCTPERPECPFPLSKWIDVTSAPSDGNWIPAEGERLDELLQELDDLGADFSEVFLITPFRAVANQIARRRDVYPGLTAGTVHVAQGREADIVILILGGNPHRPYARKWAAEKPNLLNVAISRARRRLYVIGDKGDWSKRDYFKTLAAKLDPPPDQHSPE
jgi:superfamily I DNA/RNA helicase